MIEISYIKIKKIIYLYMLLPLFCFIGLYFHFILGGIFLIILYVLSIKKVKVGRGNEKRIMIYIDKSKSEDFCRIELKYLLIFAVIAIVWSFLGGQGNLFYQSDDWGCRNAVYRDIIYRDWPVIYPDYDKALVYYIGYWLPAATVVKMIGFLLPNIYLTECAFSIGNILLWIWTSTGVFLTELLLLTYAKPKSKYKVYFIPLILVFFSGLDIIGVLRNIVVWQMQFLALHLEWWGQGLQFSSLTTCLFWVFNQTIVPWMAILCVLQEERVNNYVFIGICAFAAGPIPMLGIGVFMILNGLYRGISSINTKSIKRFIIEVFSPVNCMAILIVPVFLLYYMSNQAINNGMSNTSHGIFSVFRFEVVTNEFIREVIFFWILEAGLYLILLYRNYKNDIFYYIVIVTTIIAPFIKVGEGVDFVMRFSIPSIMVLAAMCLKYLVNFDFTNTTRKIDKSICILLCACLMIGAMTPLTEFFRGYSVMLQTGKIANVCDNVVTFNQDTPANNFTAHDYKNSLFFKYLYPEE